MKILSLWTVLLLLPAVAPASPPKSDVCAGAKGAVTIETVSFADGVVKAAGTWRVGEGRAGALIEYRIQSDRQAAEVHSGPAGTWEAALPYGHCGRSVLRVDAFPSVKSGELQVHCLADGQAATRSFEVDCSPAADLGPCQWECAEPAGEKGKTFCSGSCTATARGGEGSLVAMIGVDDEDYQLVEGPEFGPWTATVTCEPGHRVTFKVRDHVGSGAFSKVAELPCGKE
jgi:hypothetical protein